MESEGSATFYPYFCLIQRLLECQFSFQNICIKSKKKVKLLCHYMDKLQVKTPASKQQTPIWTLLFPLHNYMLNVLTLVLRHLTEHTRR